MTTSHSVTDALQAVQRQSEWLGSMGRTRTPWRWASWISVAGA